MVDIFIINLSDEFLSINTYIEYISLERRVQISKYKKSIDKKRSLLTELLLKKIINEKTSIPIEKISFMANQYGKPYLENVSKLKFNASHSGIYITVATSNSSVGVDIEEIKEINYQISKRCFTQKEHDYLMSFDEQGRLNEFYKIWTLKESYIKNVGKGLSIPLNSFEFDLDKFPAVNIKNSRFKFFSIKLNNYFLSVCSIEKRINLKINVISEKDILEFYNNLS